MKYKNYLLVSTLLLALITSCSGQRNTEGSSGSSKVSSEQSESDSSSSQKPTRIDINLGNYVANLQNANSIYIKKKGGAISSSLKRANDDNKLTLVKASTEYDEEGKVVNENEESDVSFKKISTENKTQTIEGEEEYISYEDGTKVELKDDALISFTSESDKNYSVFDENYKVIVQNIVDNGKEDVSSESGTIKIDGLEAGKEYLVKSYSKTPSKKTNCTPVLEGQDIHGDDYYSISIMGVGDGAILDVVDSNNVLVIDAKQDNGPEDLDPSLGRVKFTNLKDGGTYTYRNYISSTIITSLGNKTAESYKKEVSSTNYSISFKTYEGFTYQICDVDGTVLIDNFTDNCDKDADPEVGIAKIKALDKNTTYVVKYSGLGEEIIETQDEIDAEIDKTYVYSPRFSFTSFVAVGESKRPSGKNLTIGEDGVADYDKKDYYSDQYRQSFLIDNNTGLVYKIEGIKIAIIEKRVLYLDSASSTIPYGFKINDDNELEVFKLVQNSTISFTNVFGDKYNQYYVNTTDVSGINNNTIFYSGDVYMYLNTGTVLKFINNGQFDQIWKVGFGFSDVEIANDETITINARRKFNYNNRYVTEIKNGYLYSFDNQVSASIMFMRIKICYDETVDAREIYTSIKYNAYGGWSVIISDNVVLSLLADESKSSGSAKVYNLYYSYIWEVEENEAGITSPMHNEEGYMEQEAVFNNRSTSALLLEECGCSKTPSNEDTFKPDKYLEAEFKKVTFTDTEYYKVVMDEGYPTIINSGSYVPPAESNIIIQPINR